MTLDQQVDKLEYRLEAFTASVVGLDERLFLSKINGWTPRDIVAHLHGWNLHIVRGAKQILCGELPFYDVDPGPDYSGMNAALVRLYANTDRSVLLAQLSDSARALKSFLGAIDPGEWSRDFGVRHKGERLTVKSTVDDLIADYDHHRGPATSLRLRARLLSGAHNSSVGWHQLGRSSEARLTPPTQSHRRILPRIASVSASASSFGSSRCLDRRTCVD